MKISSLIVAAVASFLSMGAYATVINTLDGIDYEWLELTETQGIPRSQIELRLSDPNDALYGYQYASRSLVENLFLSYASWDGIKGLHGAPDVATGMGNYLSDFGTTYTYAGNGNIYQTITVDDYSVEFLSGYELNHGLYGLPSECGGENYTCRSQTSVYFDIDHSPVMVFMDGTKGHSSTELAPFTLSLGQISNSTGSFLVRTNVVPIPAAIWLFGSGLIGLVGIARRKKA